MLATPSANSPALAKSRLLAINAAGFSPNLASPLFYGDASLSTLFTTFNGSTRAVNTNDPIGYYADLSTNANNATQSVSAGRATLNKAAIHGLNSIGYNGTTAYLALTSPITLSGAFTAWAICTYVSSATLAPFGSVATPGALLIFSDNNVYTVNDAATFSTTPYTGSMGTIACRWRRTAANEAFFKATGMAEVDMGALTGTITLNALGARPNVAQFNGTGNYHAMQAIYGSDLVTANPAFVAAMKNYLTARYGVGV